MNVHVHVSYYYDMGEANDVEWPGILVLTNKSSSLFPNHIL